MPEGDAYRKRAKECRELAEKFKDNADLRDQYLELARKWEAMARDVEGLWRSTGMKQ